MSSQLCAKNYQHQIQIINFLPNERVTYAVLLLKGTINDCCLLTAKSINVKICGNDDDFPCTDIKRGNDSLGLFKCLLQLHSGENTIRITYCRTTLDFHIIYDNTPILNNTQPIVKIYYIICNGHDGCFQSDKNDNTIAIACQKIDTSIQLIQCLIAEKLNESEFKLRKTFQFIHCQPFYSTLNVQDARTWSSQRIWDYLAREFVSNDGDKLNTKYVGFLGCTLFTGIDQTKHYCDNDVKLNTTAHIALGAGDVAIFGTGCLYTWPNTIQNAIDCFNNKTIVDISKLMDDSNSRRTYGGCFATTVGSLCHEIGHIFNLGHTEEGIMGNGFDYINRVFVHERTTTVLPQRMVNVCQQNATDQVITNGHHRLTKIKKPNEFLINYQNQRDNDLTYFCDNSNIMLFYHKWLNISSSIENKTHSIQMDKLNGLAVSTLPIRLIEFRDRLNALSINYIAFLNENIFSYKIPEQQLLRSYDYDMLIVDDNGNIVKC